MRPHLKLFCLMLAIVVLAGCSADPRKGRVAAPPDRLQAPPVMAARPPEEIPDGRTGSIPLGDGSESVAPNYSGHLPRLQP